MCLFHHFQDDLLPYDVRMDLFYCFKSSSKQRSKSFRGISELSVCYGRKNIIYEKFGRTL